MTKKEVAQKIKNYGYTIISKSWFVGDDDSTVIFNGYDRLGNCYHFFIDFNIKYATKQFLSATMIHDARDISDLIFK